MNRIDFLREQFGGSNWVVARRSSRIVARYGDDVICISRQKYKQAEQRYEQTALEAEARKVLSRLKPGKYRPIDVQTIVDAMRWARETHFL